MIRIPFLLDLRFVDQSLTVASDLTRQIASQISELSSLVQQTNLDREAIRNRRSNTLLAIGTV